MPPGTIIKSVETEEVLADLVEEGQRAVIARGGRGGRGNSRFATPRNPAPDFSENGEPGEELDVTLELKLLADVGLVGFPSVGNQHCYLLYLRQNLKLELIILQQLNQI